MSNITSNSKVKVRPSKKSDATSGEIVVGTGKDRRSYKAVIFTKRDFAKINKKLTEIDKSNYRQEGSNSMMSNLSMTALFVLSIGLCLILCNLI